MRLPPQGRAHANTFGKTGTEVSFVRKFHPFAYFVYRCFGFGQQEALRLGNTQVANPFFKVFVFAGINVRGKIGAVGTQFMGNHFDIEFGLKVAFFFSHSPTISSSMKTESLTTGSSSITSSTTGAITGN